MTIENVRIVSFGAGAPTLGAQIDRKTAMFGVMPEQARLDSNFDDSLAMAVEDGYNAGSMPLEWLLLPNS